jgi:hypothetical protein
MIFGIKASTFNSDLHKEQLKGRVKCVTTCWYWKTALPGQYTLYQKTETEYNEAGNIIETFTYGNFEEHRTFKKEFLYNSCCNQSEEYDYQKDGSVYKNLKVYNRRHRKIKEIDFGALQKPSDISIFKYYNFRRIIVQKACILSKCNKTLVFKYDSHGNQISNATYYNNKFFEGTATTYNDRGNEQSSILTNANPNYKFILNYVYNALDNSGNWTQMTLTADNETEGILYRIIDYY